MIIRSSLRLGRRLVVACALTAPLTTAAVAEEKPAERLPNFVIMFADDLGYSDVGVFGAKGFKTPHIDKLASEGVKFTDFYVAQPVCSASRTGLLTGCYPNRVGISGALGPGAKHGIHSDEMTIAEVVKQKGYATAIFGKWHLGHHKQFLPSQHGFDEYHGLPYSNDMWPYHPTTKRFPKLPLIEGDEVINANVTGKDQTQLTTWATERGVKFIEKNKDKPFLLYMPYSMPHVPLYVSDKYRGKTQQGMYGDVIAEIDWSAGQLMAALQKHKLTDNTLVIFTSDNGPWLSYGNHGGSCRPLREGKGTCWEGGVREPCIMSWPGKIPAGSICKQPAMTIDLLPTVAKLVGAKLPDHKIDGKDIWPLMSGEKGAKSPHEAYFFYYANNQLQAMRSGKWKLQFPHRYRSLTGTPGADGKPAGYTQKNCGLELYDLENDIGETKNVASGNPDVISKLQKLADAMRDDLGDSLQKKPRGKGVREPGRLAASSKPKPVKKNR